MQVITAHTVGKTQTFAIYTIIRDGSQRGNVCKHAHSCHLQSMCDVRHYHIRCGKTKCVWLSTHRTRFIIMNCLWCARHRKTPMPRICLENSRAWNLPGFRQNHKTLTLMSMRAQTTRKDEAFGIFEILETIIRTTICIEAPYPRRFLGRVGRTPLSPTLTWRRFQMPSRKGVKNRLFRIDAHQCTVIKWLENHLNVFKRSNDP